MTVKYLGKSCISPTKGKTYRGLSIENGWFRIIDDTNEDYHFSPDQLKIIEQ